VKTVAIALLLASTTALAETAPSVTRSAWAPHPSPRAKLSYRRFAISDLNGDNLWLDGAQLDVYALSRRWVRAGIELEGGVGKTSLLQTPTTLGYGLAGVTAGIQYPWRVTPFVDGRFAGGLLAGQLNGSLNVAGTDYGGMSAATWMYGGGIDTGVEIYTVGRVYLSGAVGWVRTTWHGPDFDGTLRNPSSGMQFKDYTGDSFTFKVGVGL
jgi:hypothetical protein